MSLRQIIPYQNWKFQPDCVIYQVVCGDLIAHGVVFLNHDQPHFPVINMSLVSKTNTTFRYVDSGKYVSYKDLFEEFPEHFEWFLNVPNCIGDS